MQQKYSFLHISNISILLISDTSSPSSSSLTQVLHAPPRPRLSTSFSIDIHGVSSPSYIWEKQRLLLFEKCNAFYAVAFYPSIFSSFWLALVWLSLQVLCPPRFHCIISSVPFRGLFISLLSHAGLYQPFQLFWFYWNEFWEQPSQLYLKYLLLPYRGFPRPHWIPASFL